jgi:signal transduction histidine kinase
MSKFSKNDFCEDVSYQFVRKNGEVVGAPLSAIIKRYGKENIASSTAMLTDVKENRKIETQLNQSKGFDPFSNLVSSLAHDFSNLLVAIIGNVELSLMRIGKDSPLRKDMEEIKKAADRAASLNRHLLDLCRR